MKLKYVVVFEQLTTNWGAYAPDVPGCGSVGDTWEEICKMIDEGLTAHIEWMLEDGDPLPEPKMSIDEAITYHSEAISDDLLARLGIDEPPPTISTRFEFVEINVQVPEPANDLSEPVRDVREAASVG